MIKQEILVSDENLYTTCIQSFIHSLVRGLVTWSDGPMYYMKFWRHFNLAILAIFQEIAKLKDVSLNLNHR